jgi:hypothetical protein
MSLSCPAKQEPAAGIYARYSKLPRPVELNFDAPDGANYLVRLVDAQTETPVISYFIRGGQHLATSAPAGQFVLKAASGDHWCGEASLFGSDTSIVETGRPVTFALGESHTISLQPRPNGNLPLRNIGRVRF